MNDNKKKYQVSIFGENYILVSDEPEAVVVQAAQRVDLFMQEIAHKLGVSGNRDAGARQCAILAALRLANQLLQVESHVDTAKSLHEKLLTLVERSLQT
jgi:cell division protein ZapA (FtsZ GTPase activity inhibitor)